mmetsp:Transcript_14329/g.60368  ORF Transcript_14329/g.60368 Transcript_14329/m.60368 type:complete len:274 (+) Transcript_14329:2468-3289(+)
MPRRFFFIGDARDASRVSSADARPPPSGGLLLRRLSIRRILLLGRLGRLGRLLGRFHLPLPRLPLVAELLDRLVQRSLLNRLLQVPVLRLPLAPRPVVVLEHGVRLELPVVDERQELPALALARRALLDALAVAVVAVVEPAVVLKLRHAALNRHRAPLVARDALHHAVAVALGALHQTRPETLLAVVFEQVRLVLAHAHHEVVPEASPRGRGHDAFEGIHLSASLLSACRRRRFSEPQAGVRRGSAGTRRPRIRRCCVACRGGNLAGRQLTC